jgi:hypothetical protein
MIKPLSAWRYYQNNQIQPPKLFKLSFSDHQCHFIDYSSFDWSKLEKWHFFIYNSLWCLIVLY